MVPSRDDLDGNTLPALPDHIFGNLMASGISDEYPQEHAAFIRTSLAGHRLLLAKQYLQDALACRRTASLSPSNRQLRLQYLTRHPLWVCIIQVWSFKTFQSLWGLRLLSSVLLPPAYLSFAR